MRELLEERIQSLVKMGEVRISQHGYDQLNEAEMNTGKRVKYIHEGKYAAEVDVDLIEDEAEWSPYLTVEDAEKLDDVREALVRGDIEEASKKARIYTLEPVAVSQ